HPMFLQQLARFAQTPTRATESAGRRTLTLQTVLQDRVRALPTFAREVLELTCVAAQPLTPAILLAAAELGDPDHRAAALALLVGARLARSPGVGAAERRRVEPFHDQVRRAVVDLLTPDLRRGLHARLARTLAREPDVEPQVLVTHYQEAGDRHAAFEAA